jgi:hypothetical protein
MKKVKKGVIFVKNAFAILWIGNIIFTGIIEKSTGQFRRLGEL